MTGEPKSLGILVGFDGSDHAIRALHWGAVEALRRGCPLSVMTAFTVPRGVAGYVDSASETTGDSLARTGAERLLEEAGDLLKDFPAEVQYFVRYGDAAGVMVAHSSDAELCVVGARGRGGFIGRMLGSVSSALPAHSSCPTVIVDPSYEPPQGEGPQRFTSSDERPVSVGMDQSKGAKIAALHAAEVAAAHKVPLRVVMAIPPLDSALLWYPELGPRDDQLERRRAETEDRLSVQVQWLSKHFDDLVISAAVRDGLPAGVLRDETEGSQLTVVGTRGRGGLASTLMGSTSAGVVTHAAGPVMVVPALEDSRLNDEGAH